MNRVAAFILLVGGLLAPATRAGESLQSGWEHFRLAEFSLAAKSFERVVAEAKEPDERAKALYGLATTWNLRRPGESPEKATAIYRQVLEVAPRSDTAAWSLLALARMNPTNTAYQEVIDRFPEHAAGAEAFLFQQAARLTVPNADTSRAVRTAVTEWVAAHPQSPYRSAGYKLIGHCCHLLGDFRQEFDAIFQAWHTTEVDPRNPTLELAATYWGLATLAEFDLGDFALARQYYRKLIEEYPTDQRVFMAKKELQHMDEVEAQLRREVAR